MHVVPCPPTPFWLLLILQIFVTSKISPYEQGESKAHQACLDIIAKLGLGHVDLALVHWPGVSKTTPDSDANSRLRMETWRVMERFYREGKFRAIGVSNYEESHLVELLELADVPPAVNQFEVHPRRPARSLRKACEDRGGLNHVRY